MKTPKKRRRTGLIVQPDDLSVGEFYAVLGLKNGLMEPVQIAGMGFRIVAMNLPFVIGRMVTNPANTVTFDSRYLSFMKVSEDFVRAQRPTEDSDS